MEPALYAGVHAHHVNRPFQRSGRRSMPGREEGHELVDEIAFIKTP